MRADVRTVGSEMTLPELDRAFLREGVSGYPVLKDGRLIGIVSRSDVIRQLCVEQSVSEVASDYYRFPAGLGNPPAETLEDVGQRVGRRIETLRVKDVMSSSLITVSPEDSLADVARILTEHHVHRVLVTKDGRLVGIISALDFVRRIAAGGLHLE
jgi:CBS domain-containing protein